MDYLLHLEQKYLITAINYFSPITLKAWKYIDNIF